MAEPADRFYESQGLRLHYVDWGNVSAPPLILVHGGLDHCRNWDAIARELQPHFHIVAPDLRGRVRAKTGHIGGVSTLSGYVESAGGATVFTLTLPKAG